MKRLTLDEQAQYKDYKGMDINIETSLFEYGFIAKPLYDDNGVTKEYHIIYGVTVADYGDNEFIAFDWSNLSKTDYIKLLQEEWLDLPAVLSYADSTPEAMAEFTIENIYTLIQYHGYENILGACYDTFIIGVDDSEVI